VRNPEKYVDIMFTNNIYDRLWVSNYCDVMGDNFLLWPLPIFHSMKGNGLFYPKLPDFDMNDLHHVADSMHVEHTMEMSESRESALVYARSSLFKYKNQLMNFDDKVFEIPEDHPDMPNPTGMADYEDSD
jgi:hypothetical protein